MADWNSTQYLKFKSQRTQPALDLAARIDINPLEIIDIGCGPGNSTRVVPDTALGLYGMRMQRSFLLVSIFITGGCIMGTSAMYEYAATIMGP